MNLFNFFNKKKDNNINIIIDKDYLFYASMTFSLVIILIQTYISVNLRKYIRNKKLELKKD